MKESYRSMLADLGENVTLRRINVSPTPATDETVLARVKRYEPNELVGGITQADRKVIVMAEDIGAFPVPIKTGGSDKVVVRGRVMNIQEVDDSTCRYGPELIAYLITARG